MPESLRRSLPFVIVVGLWNVGFAALWVFATQHPTGAASFYFTFFSVFMVFGWLVGNLVLGFVILPTSAPPSPTVRCPRCGVRQRQSRECRSCGYHFPD
jgi:hypothetical protein